MRFNERINLGLSMLAMAISLASGIAFAQSESQEAPPPPPGPGMFHARPGSGPEMAPDAVGFVGFEEGLGDKTVTGAPFTASFSTESTQTLADGNQIKRNISGTFARDGQGRTRREMTLPPMGPWADSGKPAPHVVFINDPVAGTRYALEPDRKIARKMPAPRAGNRGKSGAVAAQFLQKHQGEVITTSLGTQTIGGISAEGTRYTRTIPSGEIGNAKPIQIITERWYSPDLQTFVMTKHSDPRMGETVFQLTNIQRQEPGASLFQVPSDYTVKQGLRRPGARGARQNQVQPPTGSPQAEPPQPEPPQE